MMKLVYSSWLLLSVIGQVESVDNLAKQGTTLANLSNTAIWAIVSLISIVGLIYVYKQKSKDEQELKVIIRETAINIQKNTDTLQKLNDNIDKCPKR